MAGVTNSATKVTRWTGPTVGHAGPTLAYDRPVGHYPIAGFEQDSSVFEVMYSTHPKHYQLPHQHTGLSPLVYMIMDQVHVPRWSCSTVSWGWAALMAAATGPTSFPPEA